MKFLFLVLTPFTVLAQEPSLADKIGGILDSAIAQSVVIAMVLQFVLQLIPSAKPMGVLHSIAGVLKIVANLCAKGAELLDKVIPLQKLK